MTPCWSEAKLDDYLDGQLSGEEAGRLEAHLESCASCRKALADHRRVHLEAGELPQELEPPRNLWPGIEARLGERWGGGAAGGSTGDARSSARGWGLAAAALLALSIGLVIYGLMTPQPPGASSGHRGPEVNALSPLGSTPLLTTYRRADTQLDEVATGLEIGYEARRSALSPGARVTIERNLAVVDAAIELSRAALEKDPTDQRAAATLRDMQKKKIQLLELANGLPYRL